MNIATLNSRLNKIDNQKQKIRGDKKLAALAQDVMQAKGQTPKDPKEIQRRYDKVQEIIDEYHKSARSKNITAAELKGVYEVARRFLKKMTKSRYKEVQKYATEMIAYLDDEYTRTARMFEHQGGPIGKFTKPKKPGMLGKLFGSRSPEQDALVKQQIQADIKAKIKFYKKQKNPEAIKKLQAFAKKQGIPI